MLLSRIAAGFLVLMPRKRVSRAIGDLAGVKWPRPVLERAIELYCRAYDVDLSDFEEPDGGWQTFREFFARPLRPGAREIDRDPDVLVSPADGRIEDCGAIDARATFRVKGRPYKVGELLGDRRDAGRFEGGRFAIIYLSPRDYHRVHAPVDGSVHAVRHVGGTLFPVNRIGLEHVTGLFAKNERIAVFQDSRRMGEVATLLVGAIAVGGVALSFEPSVHANDGPVRGTIRYVPGRQPVLARGDELGVFNLGSTVVVLTTREAALQLAVDPGMIVKVGQALGRSQRPMRLARIA